jgi:hypothetical protein
MEEDAVASNDIESPRRRQFHTFLVVEHLIARIETVSHIASLLHGLDG